MILVSSRKSITEREFHFHRRVHVGSVSTRGRKRDLDFS